MLLFLKLKLGTNGDSQVAMLDVLYEYFPTHLHALVQRDNHEPIRNFEALTLSENVNFVSMFVRCFRNETEVLVETMEHNGAILTYSGSVLFGLAKIGFLI